MNKKMIAPIVIGVIVSGYFLMWIAMVFCIEVNLFVASIIGLPFDCVIVSLGIYRERTY